MGVDPAFIFCRGGSKGIPDKNLRKVGGKPLLTRAVETARAVPELGTVYVSTDSARIAEVAERAGAQVIERPADLASDTAVELDAWRHALTTVGPVERFVSVPATSPLRKPSDISAALARFDQGDCDLVTAVTPSEASPWLTMVQRDSAGHIAPILPPEGRYRRQDMPETFDLCGLVYVADPAYVRTCSFTLEGRVGAIVISPERAIDIDTPFDLHLAELLIANPYEAPE